ncbi:unnamed protein product, partial [Hapterophycus canaliculatus]
PFSGVRTAEKGSGKRGGVPFGTKRLLACQILFLPCAHQCTCSRCGLGYTGRPCILCRRNVDKVQKVIKIRNSR